MSSLIKSVIAQAMVRDVGYGVPSQDQVSTAVDAYLQRNPVEPGATTEEAAQIRQNTEDVGALKQSDEQQNTEIQKHATAIENLQKNETGNGSGGLSSTEKTLMLSLFKNAMYATDTDTTLAQLEAYWNGSGGSGDSGGNEGGGDTGGDSGDEPGGDTPPVVETLPSWIAEMQVVEFTPEADTNEVQTFAISMENEPNVAFVLSDFEAKEKTRDFVGMLIMKSYSGRCDAIQYNSGGTDAIVSATLNENGTTMDSNNVVITTGNVGTEACYWRAGHTYKIYCIKTTLDISLMNDVPFANEVCAIEYQPEADTNEAVTFNYEMENEPNMVLILSDITAFEKYRDIVGVAYTKWYDNARTMNFIHNSTAVASGTMANTSGYATAENGVLAYVPSVSGGTACYFRAGHKYMILLMNV